jgi:hypothetical protein
MQNTHKRDAVRLVGQEVQTFTATIRSKGNKVITNEQKKGGRCRCTSPEHLSDSANVS